MWSGRQQPSPRTLRWVEQTLGGTAQVVAWRRLTGGITSAVHRLTIDHGRVDIEGMTSRVEQLIESIMRRR